MQSSARWANEVISGGFCFLCARALAAGSFGRGVVAGLRHRRLCSGSPLLSCLTWTLSIPASLLASTASHFCSLTLSKWEQKSGFLPLPVVLLLNDTAAPHHGCVPSPFVLFLISCFSQSCSFSSIISHNASIHPSFALQWFSCLFVSFSLSFPHRLLPDKENSRTFMCFP